MHRNPASPRGLRGILQEDTEIVQIDKKMSAVANKLEPNLSVHVNTILKFLTRKVKSKVQDHQQ